jgi:dihydrofolate reductase
VAAVVIGRRLFDLTNGWDGTPAAGEHVFSSPTRRRRAGSTPILHRSPSSMASRRRLPPPSSSPGTETSNVAAGQIGSQAFKLGLIDQVVLNPVPVVFGSGRPFFATGALAEPLQLENPTTIVRGDRVTRHESDGGPRGHPVGGEDRLHEAGDDVVDVPGDGDLAGIA